MSEKIMRTDETTLQLDELCFDANDPLPLARFWAEALRWEVDDDDPDEVELVPTDGTRFASSSSRSPSRRPARTASIST